MTFIEQVQEAAAVRERLRNPPNAVVDRGINLKLVDLGRVVAPCVQPIIIREEPTLRDIADFVCKRHPGVKVRDILGARRMAEITTARQMFCYLAVSLRSCTLKEIGRWLNKDHSSVLYGYRKLSQMAGTDQNYAESLQRMKNEIFAHLPAHCFDAREI